MNQIFMLDPWPEASHKLKGAKEKSQLKWDGIRATVARIIELRMQEMCRNI